MTTVYTFVDRDGERIVHALDEEGTRAVHSWWHDGGRWWCYLDGRWHAQFYTEDEAVRWLVEEAAP